MRDSQVRDSEGGGSTSEYGANIDPHCIKCHRTCSTPSNVIAAPSGCVHLLQCELPSPSATVMAFVRGIGLGGGHKGQGLNF